MKRKLSFLFLSALTIPFFMVSCSDDKEEQEVKPATDLVVDNNSVTLLQGDEITVSITSGNGDYWDIGYSRKVSEVLQFLKIGEMAAADWMHKFVCRI